MDIGRKIRKLRREKDITLEELSKKSGVALATLSRMETGKMTGTIGSHKNICKALNISIADLYKEAEDESKTVERISRGKRTELFTQSARAKQELLVTETHDKKILPTLLTISPGGSTQNEEDKEGTEKFIYVTCGAVEATVGKNNFTLKKGDSLYFDASLSHRFENSGKTEARAIYILSPSR